MTICTGDEILAQFLVDQFLKHFQGNSNTFFKRNQNFGRATSREKLAFISGSFEIRSYVLNRITKRISKFIFSSNFQKESPGYIFGQITDFGRIINKIINKSIK